MAQTRLLFFQDADGTAPVWEWLKDLRARNPKAYDLLPARVPTLLSETLKMRSQKTQKRTSDALALVEKLTGKTQEMADLVEQEQANLDIARKIYQLRTKAKLSQAKLPQAKLARKVGTTQSAISRLE